MSEETNIHRESRLAKLRALEESGYNPILIVFNRRLLRLICRKNIKTLKPVPTPKTA